MSVEEQLRAAGRALTDQVRDIPDLDLTAAEPARRPARGRARAAWSRTRPARHWPTGWLIPLAAAATVVAVAATLTAVRGLSGTGPGTPPQPGAPSASASLPSGAPRYYVALTDIGTSKGGAPMRNAFLADAGTGKQLATFRPPPDAVFDYVAASSDGRTFVLEASEGSDLGPSGSTRSKPVSKPNIYYVLRLPQGSPGQARLSRVPITASPGYGGTEELAVSPDGGTLAILSQAISDVTGVVKPSGPTRVRTYSLATGRLLHVWAAPLSSSSINGLGDLSWLNDGRTLAFAYQLMATQQYVRTLNTTSPGTNLIADSHTVFTVPAGHTCDDSLLVTSDGKSVICGVFAPNNGWCTTGQLALNVYSVATGKLERVLYQYHGGCHFGTAQVVWAKSAALAIALVEVSKPVTPYPPVTNMVIVAAPGKSTLLPVTLMGGTYQGPGTIGF